jgi:hypothetical protein
VDRNLPGKHEYHVVPNSGHFAFLIPCPPTWAKAVPEICTDAPGFDRFAFHKQFNADVLAFFRGRPDAGTKPKAKPMVKLDAPGQKGRKQAWSADSVRWDRGRHRDGCHWVGHGRRRSDRHRT